MDPGSKGTHVVAEHCTGYFYVKWALEKCVKSSPLSIVPYLQSLHIKEKHTCLIAYKI